MNLKSTLILLLLIVPFFASAQYKGRYVKIDDNTWQGTASYYHNKFNGRKTANGEIFSNSKMTAANNFLKLGTYVRATNLKNGKSVVVKINDRMAKNNRRLIDMSKEAARRLGYVKSGLGKLKIEVIPNPE